MGCHVYDHPKRKEKRKERDGNYYMCVRGDHQCLTERQRYLSILSYQRSTTTRARESESESERGERWKSGVKGQLKMQEQNKSKKQAVTKGASQSGMRTNYELRIWGKLQMRARRTKERRGNICIGIRRINNRNNEGRGRWKSAGKHKS